MIPMERTHEYHGVYHVLGGALSPIDGIDPEDLKIAELLARVAGRRRATVREVVLATNPTTTGEATALTSPRSCADAPPSSRSPVWPAACRSAPTSSTPTRSRSARPSPGAGPCSRADGSFVPPRRLPARSQYPRRVSGTIVMKFGGTSVADAERIKRAARRIVEKRETGTRWSRCSRRGARRPTS